MHMFCVNVLLHINDTVFLWSLSALKHKSEGEGSPVIKAAPPELPFTKLILR